MTSLNTLTIAGPRAQYLLNVDASGNVTAVPTVSGSPASGASINDIQFSDVSVFVLNASQSTVALLYEAALGREPDIAGLQTWVNVFNGLPASVIQSGDLYQELSGTSGNFNGSMSIADGFVNSAEFQTKYGPLTDSQYVTQLYANVLHRAPDAGGMDTWMAALTPAGQTYTDATTGQTFAGQGESRAYVLVGFAESTENIADCAATATTTSTSGWLINTSNGTYTDPGYTAPVATEPVQTVLQQAASTNTLNTAQIDISTLTSLVNVGDFSVSPAAGGGSWASINTGANQTLLLSTSITSGALGATATNGVITGSSGGHSDITVIGPGTGDTINLAGTSNALYFTTQNTPSTATPTNITVTGYVAGHDTIQMSIESILIVGQLTPLPVSIITGGNGANLNFTQNMYVLNAGNVGDGSASAVATAANSVYTVSDTNGNASALIPASATGENLVIIGTTSAGSTVIYEWATFSTTAGGHNIAPIQTADTNHNHQVDGNELTLVATLVGVQSSQLTAADFH